MKRGPVNIGNKLCAKNVSRIKAALRCARRGDGKQIANKFRVSQSMVSKIKHGKNWGHVK